MAERMYKWCVIAIVCQAIIAQASDENYIRSTIKNVLGYNRHHAVNATNKERVMRHIHDEFTRFGLETNYHTFTRPAIAQNVEFHNIIGILKGQRFGTPKDKIVGLAAHYDTVRLTSGVDDNGSGVAALLEVARRMKHGYHRLNTIIFISFDMEEIDLAGSEEFVKTWWKNWLATIHASTTTSINGVIVLDTIMNYNKSANSQVMPDDLKAALPFLFPEVDKNLKADNYRGDFLSTIHRNAHDQILANTFNNQWSLLGKGEHERFELESFGLRIDKLTTEVQIEYSDFLRSDHKSFWLYGYPAIFLTDTANYRGKMQKCYHEPCDNLGWMMTDDNIKFLCKTADAIFNTLHHLSEPKAIIVQASDEDYIRATIKDVLGYNRHHEVNATNKERVMRHIHDEFTRFGLETTYHTFTSPAIAQTVKFHNIIGILKGQRFGTANDKIVGLAAHYDTVSSTSGVDDNGSGVAALLGVARRMKQGYDRLNTIIFISFDVEEIGLTGSEVFVKTWWKNWLETNYASTTTSINGVIVLDTIMNYNKSAHSQVIPDKLKALLPGFFPEVDKNVKADNYSGDFLATIHRNVHDQILADTFKKQWGLVGHGDRERFDLESFGLSIDNLTTEELKFYSDFLRSDHRSFWMHGYPAIFLTDTANYRGKMQECYHEPCDNLEWMMTDDNIKFLCKTADAIFNTLHHLSEPKVTSSSEILRATNISVVVTLVLLALIP